MRKTIIPVQKYYLRPSAHHQVLNEQNRVLRREPFDFLFNSIQKVPEREASDPQDLVSGFGAG